MKTYLSCFSRETKKLGEVLARKVLRKGLNPRGAAVIALTGELGSGKTTFVKGFFRGLGSRARVISPTFVIIRRTALKRKKFKNVFHVDAYRIKKPSDILRLGFREVLSDPQNIIIIEWAEKLKRFLPPESLWFKFDYSKEGKGRKITLDWRVPISGISVVY